MRSENIDGIEIQPFGSSVQWANPVLKQDIYRIWLNSGNRIESRMFVQDGRRELLKLVETNLSDRFSIVRDSWINTEFPWRPQVSANGWTFSWIGSRLNGSNLEMLLALENVPARTEDSLDNPLLSPEPVDISFVIKSNENSNIRYNGIIRRVWDYPANTWKLTIFDWQSLPITPSVEIIIDSGKKFTPLLTLIYNKDYSDSGELNNQSYASSDLKITISRFSKEMRLVPDNNFKGNILKPCWIIRTNNNRKEMIRADLEFSHKLRMNSEYRYFSDSGICETIIWPATDNIKLDDLETPQAISMRSGLNNETRIPDDTIHLILRNKNIVPSEKDPWPLPIELRSENNYGNQNNKNELILPPALGPVSPLLTVPNSP